jgi:putative hydrolase of the HAD superfamily
MNEKQDPRKAVIFDRDGVLVDFDLDRVADFLSARVAVPLEELQQLFGKLGQTVGFPKSMQEEEKFWFQFWEKVADRVGLDDSAKHELRNMDIYQFLKPYPEAQPVLAALTSRGWRVGVLSNFVLASIEPSLKAVGLLPYTHTALSCATLGVWKPEPEAYLSMTRALSVEPANCFYFDDDPPLVEGARNLGMKAYLVDRTCSAHQLGNYVIRDLTAVIDIINSDSI